MTVYLFLLNNGTLGIFKNGIAFLQMDSNYTTTYMKLGDTPKVELNLNDLERNLGKVVFSDGECTIDIEAMELTPEKEYIVFFRTHGVYTLNEGRLISPLKHFVTENRFQTHDFAEGSGLKTSIGNEIYLGTERAMMGLEYKDGDGFAYSLFPLENYEYGELLLEGDIKDSKVEIQFTGLVEHSWEKDKDSTFFQSKHLLFNLIE